MDVSFFLLKLLDLRPLGRFVPSGQAQWIDFSKEVDRDGIISARFFGAFCAVSAAGRGRRCLRERGPRNGASSGQVETDW